MAHPPPVTPEAADAEAVDPDAFATADRVRALNAANPRWWPRYETAYGDLLVTPSPGWDHQGLIQELAFALRGYLERVPVGVVRMAPADISWGRRDVTVQPDVFVIALGDAHEARRTKQWASIRHLLLVAEVTSPSTRHRDRFEKRLLYQRQGVELYWVIDPERREAEVWTPDADLPQTERERLTWHPAGATEAFVFDLAGTLARLDVE